MKTDNVTVCTATRNTKFVNTDILTNTMLKSVIKQCKSFTQYDIVVYDCNYYDGEKYKPDEELSNLIHETKQLKSFTIIDNSQRKKSGATKWLKINNYPVCNCGDIDHSSNIQYLLDNINCDNFVLFDNDIILKKDIIDFCDTSYITSCKLYNTKIPQNSDARRCMPHIQYINRKMFKELDLIYFKYDILEKFKHVGKIIHHNGIDFETFHYPTGSILHSQILSKKIPMLEIEDTDYCVHYGSANIKETNIKNFEDFIDKHSQYWKEEE